MKHISDCLPLMSRILLFCLASNVLIAQDMPASYSFASFKEASAKMPVSEQFRFDYFQKGVVYKLTGKRSEAKLNYSYLYGDILFIGPSNDTLAISDVKMVKHVSIGNTAFLVDPRYGFVEIVAEHQGVKIGKSSRWILVDFENRASFDRSGSPAAKPSEASLVRMPSNVKMEDLKNIKLRRELTFYVIDPNNRFHIANRSSLIKVYGRAKNKVGAYLDARSIDYRNEKELKKVIEEISHLAAPNGDL